MMSTYVMASCVVLAQAKQGMFKFVKHDSVPVIIKEQSCFRFRPNSTLVPGHCYLGSEEYDSDLKFIGSTKKVTCAAGVATVHVFEGSTDCSGNATKPKTCDCETKSSGRKNVFSQCYSCEAAGSSKWVSPAWTMDVSCKSLLVPDSALPLPVKCWKGAEPTAINDNGATISENADGTLKLVLNRQRNGPSKCDGPILGTASLKSGQCSSWEDAVKATVTATLANGPDSVKKPNPVAASAAADSTCSVGAGALASIVALVVASN